ncbi:kinase-like protein [Marasmius fiardii PR-910]|nr:kinase-like protein [Marasmius fiardii PR-910]
MASSNFFSNAEKMNFDNSSFSNIGQDQINNDHRVYNTQNEENYGGSGHFINHGRDQNVNTGEGNFIIGKRVALPVQNSHEQRAGRHWGGNQISHSEDTERRNPFRPLGHPTPRRNRTDTEILQWMGMLKDEKRLELLELRGERAERALEDMQRASYSPECEPSLKVSILNVMNQLSEASGRYAQCYFNPKVQKLGDTPFSMGKLFTDVWKGRIGDDPRIVALKVVKPAFTAEAGEKLKLHLQEISKLRTLHHPNVLPFIGAFYFGMNPQEICFASPWMEKGNLVEYLQDNPADSSKRFQFAWGVANGLRHLHSLNVVHGDLKPSNVLITSNEVACLSDVGLHTFKPDDLYDDEKSTPWCAPEALTEGSFTQSSDIFAYGSICYQIFAQRIPSQDSSEDVLYNAIADQEQQSERPSEINVPMLWEVMKRCWSPDISSRPVASELVKILEETASISSRHNPELNEPLFLFVLFLLLSLLGSFVVR